MKPAKKRTIRTIPQQRAQARVRDPIERVKSFDEVACGFALEDALYESDRCLLCPDPACVKACPAGNAIPDIIRRIGAKDFRGAYDLVTATNALPAVCGRVCPQEQQCEGACTVGETLEPVAIGKLERWLGDLAIAEGWASTAAPSTGFNVAVVGSGPAGLACAASMARSGCAVTVFEALPVVGGVPKYAIPAFRLPPTVMDAEVAKLRSLGVTFKCGTRVGSDFTIEQLIDEMGFHAVFLGIGAAVPAKLGIPGESLAGVVSANDLLSGCNADPASQSLVGRTVAVVGAGNTAMDALRACVRLGAKVTRCVYRRSHEESPACAEELHHAAEEGIEFHWLTQPLEMLDDGKGRVRALRCSRMELGEPDDSGRRRPIAVEGSEFELEADFVVLATGTHADPLIPKSSRIDVNRWGYIAVDRDLATSMAGVFAGGDGVTGAATVVAAVEAGTRAARGMKAYLALDDAPSHPAGSTLFGIDLAQRNFARVRAA